MPIILQEIELKKATSYIFTQPAQIFTKTYFFTEGMISNFQVVQRQMPQPEKNQCWPGRGD